MPHSDETRAFSPAINAPQRHDQVCRDTRQLALAYLSLFELLTFGAARLEARCVGRDERAVREVKVALEILHLPYVSALNQRRYDRPRCSRSSAILGSGPDVLDVMLAMMEERGGVGW